MKLLNKTDLNGKTPIIYGVVSKKRSQGKTTFFNKFLLENFIKNREKFVYVVRYKSELKHTIIDFSNDISKLFFPDYSFIGRDFGNYYEFLLNDGKNELNFGYSVALNMAYELKKTSHVFNECEYIIFDEFDNPKYCPDEFNKFMTLYKSVNRGNGKKTREVKVIMIGNMLDISNPYFIKLGLTDNYKKNGFVCGSGYVFEFFDGLESEEDKFDTVFHTHEKDYKTNIQICEKIPKNTKYFCTCEIMDVFFSIRLLPDKMYISECIEKNFKNRFSANIPPSENYIHIKNVPLILKKLLTMYYNGDIIYSSITMLYYFKQFLGV